nr:ribonuclease H-like domain-containing protein [Tanacetum cinerariifolium]
MCFFGDNLLSWSSKCQQTISRSSANAEYRGVANVVAETAWLCNLVRELHSLLSATTLVYCDNVSATYLLIQFNINGLNILRLTYILFVTWLLLVKFEFSMCPPAINDVILTASSTYLLHQQLGIDCDETFSLVVKPATIRIVFSLAVSRKWPIHQLGVKNTFLNGDLSETVYMHQPHALWTPGTLTMSAFCRSLYMV